MRHINSIFKVYLFLVISLLVGCSKEPPEVEDNPPVEALGLRDYASAKGKFIGNLMRDGMFDNEQVNGGFTDKIIKTEYNAIVLGNKMKISKKVSDCFENSSIGCTERVISKDFTFFFLL